MSRPRNQSGTRRPRTYIRNGKTVHDRGARIKRRQAPKRRLNAAAKRRAQRKPLLAGAAGLLGLGALDAILMGRWGGFLVLGSFAVGLTVTHYAWQWHKNRQAARAERLRREKAAARQAGQQRREALEKARAAHQAEPAAPPSDAYRPVPAVNRRPAPATPEPATTDEPDLEEMRRRRAEFGKRQPATEGQEVLR